MPIQLDAMDQKDLMAFWATNHRATSKEAHSLLGPRVPHPRDTLSTLAAYAMAKACSLRLLQEGLPERAAIYEEHCDIYYESLPVEARFIRSPNL